MNLVFEARPNQDGTWQVVLSRPGRADTQLGAFATEAEAEDWIDTKAGDWLRRLGPDV